MGVLGFRFEGSVWGLRVWGLGCRDLGLRVWGLKAPGMSLGNTFRIASFQACGFSLRAESGR